MQEQASYGAFGNIAQKKILRSKRDSATYVIDVTVKSCTLTAIKRIEDNSQLRPIADQRKLERIRGLCVALKCFGREFRELRGFLICETTL